MLLTMIEMDLPWTEIEYLSIEDAGDKGVLVLFAGVLAASC